MKNYNKILEAVNRGIQLALDDFDDDQVQNIKSKQVQNRDYTKEYLDLMAVVVDLGLPSRTLWCRYNLGVDSNKLLTLKDWVGNYYSWGDPEPKIKISNWYFYKWAPKGISYELSKYVTDEDFGCDDCGTWKVDNLTTIQPEDDAATQSIHIGSYNFHIPTKEQFEELIKYTTYIPTQNYKGISSVCGGIFKSTINENEIFIPAGEYMGRNGINNSNLYNTSYLWSSSLNIQRNYQAYSFAFHPDRNDMPNICHDDRYIGFPIHPVINL